MPEIIGGASITDVASPKIYPVISVVPAGTTEMTGYILGEATSVIDAPPIISGNLRVPIQARNTDVDVQIISDSHLPVHITQAEVEGFYHRRSRRI